MLNYYFGIDENEQINDFSFEPKKECDTFTFLYENNYLNILSHNNDINSDKYEEDYQILNIIFKEKIKYDNFDNLEKKVSANNIHDINTINLNDNKILYKIEYNTTNIKTNISSKKTEKELIFHITKTNKKHIKKILGRKKKNISYNNKMSQHNKYSSDNIVRKIKVKLIDSILYCLNTSFQNKKRINHDNPFLKKIFLKIDQKILKNINVNNMLKLLRTKIKDIVSENISKKYINYPQDYNKKLIVTIYEKNIEIKTISILEMTLFECLEHYRGSKYYKELEGLEESYRIIINEMKSNGETEEYINEFKNLVDKFEEYFEKRTPRTSH